MYEEKAKAERPIGEIFQESGPNREKSGKMSMQVEEVKGYYPLVSSEQNVKNQGEDIEFSVALIFGKDWIKIGDEYVQNPVASPPWPVTLKQVLKDPFARSSEKEEEEEEALNSNIKNACDSPTKIPENAFIKNHSHKSEEKYVKLHIVNKHFMSEKEEEEEDKVSSHYCRFITKRPYLYE